MTDFAPAIVISYTGQFASSLPQPDGNTTLTILLQNGQIYSQLQSDSPFTQVTTPLCFHFYDNISGQWYQVNGYEQKIYKITPTAGRYLDASQRVIYDLKDGVQVPIFSLKGDAAQTIVKCTRIPADNGCEKKSSCCSNLKSLLSSKKFKGDCFSISFEVIGCNPQVIDCFSEISSKDVDLCDGTLNPCAVPLDSCAVLLYTSCVGDLRVVVAHIFIRDPIVPHFSAQCGQIDSVNTLSAPDELASCTDPSLAIPGNGNVHAIKNWVTTSDNTGKFDPEAGVFAVSQAGDYQVQANITWNSTNSTSSPDLPQFAIIMNRDHKSTVIATTPLAATMVDNNFNVSGVNNTWVEGIDSLLPDDNLFVAFIDSTSNSIVSTVNTIPPATTFSAFKIN